MADQTDLLRREARRRKILENSENRLRRIGLAVRGEKLEDEQRLNLADGESGVRNADVHTAESKDDVTNGCMLRAQVPLTSEQQDCTIESRTSEESLTEPKRRIYSDLSDNTESTFNAKSVGRPEKLSNLRSLTDWITSSRRLPFIILAVLVNIMSACELGFLFGHSIFVPLFLLEVTDITLIKPNAEKNSALSGMLRAALLLSGVTPEKVERTAYCLHIVRKVGQDFSIYFFTFIMGYVLWSSPG